MKFKSKKNIWVSKEQAAEQISFALLLHSIDIGRSMFLNFM